MLGRFWDAKAARVLSTALIFAAVLAFIWSARETLTLFLFSVLFAYFLEPLVARLEEPLRGRGRAIATVYLVLAGLVTGLLVAFGPQMAEQARSLVTTLPSLGEEMGSGQIVSQLGQRHGWTAERQAQLQALLLSHRGELLRYGGALGAKLIEPLRHLWWVILIPILGLFFLKNGPSMAADLVKLAHRTDEKTTIRVLVRDVNLMLGSYIRAQLVLASLTLVAYTVVLSLLRVPFAFVLGPLAGVAEFVPVVGPAVAAAVILGIAFFASYHHVLLLVIFLGVWRLLQDYVNAPRIMGKSLEINPLSQIFGVLVGGEIAGVVGALISVPVIATLRIVWRRARAERFSTPEQSYPPEAIPPPPASTSE
jgi:predicted PurR-regulated permease PerM